jgi:hypothetical protein
VDTSTRLRIATRIHFALLRQYGEHVEIGRLMKAGADVREAIWVCEASGDADLAALARQLRHAERAESKAAAPKAAAPQDAAWARDTSGFGVSRPLELEEPGSTASSWLRPSSWLKRNTPAKQH